MFGVSFSYQGISSLCLFHGMINTEQYIKVLNEKGILNLQKAYPDGSVQKFTILL